MAIALFDVLQAVPFLRRRLERLGQHHDVPAVDGDLAALGAPHGAAHADDVAEIERLQHRGEADLHIFRSEEQTSALQSLMRNLYAVFCIQKKKLHLTSK